MSGDAEYPKGVFEKFRCDWLLQVAADHDAKSAMPVAVVLACGHLNRKNGLAWPGVASIREAVGAKSENTVRAAINILDVRGHIRVKRTKGGAKKTNFVQPLVDGKPLRDLKGWENENPSNFDMKTLQKYEEKPLKKLKGNLLSVPSDEPPEGGALKAPAYNKGLKVDMHTSDRGLEGRSAVLSTVGSGDNWCHINPGDDVAKMIDEADHNSIIIAHGDAELDVTAYLRDFLHAKVVEVMRRLHENKKLTAGAVRDATAAGQECYNGNQKTA